MEEYLGKDIPKLGFGLMRLPKTQENNEEIDIEQVKEMVDLFLEAGLTYFDTAYVYDGGKSEEAAKEALVKRYPRERFKLATKLNAWNGCSDEKSAKQEFYTSLERTGVEYFDYYLLHAIQTANYQKYDEYHIWDFVKELKEKGFVKNWGFSFHADPVLLERLLNEHPDVDFVQLQINYADWDNPSVAAKENYEVVRKHGKPVIIMEPVKGGLLANPPESIQKVLKEANSKMSVPSWAIRYAASLDGIITVLSGMSNVEQIKDNISYMKEFSPLNEQERSVVKNAQEILKAIPTIPCTACHYCVDGCPKKIPIPNIFGIRNKLYLYGNKEKNQMDYNRNVSGRGKASDCVSCGQCEKACPQQIDIIDRLKECAVTFQ